MIQAQRAVAGIEVSFVTARSASMETRRGTLQRRKDARQEAAMGEKKAKELLTLVHALRLGDSDGCKKAMKQLSGLSHSQSSLTVMVKLGAIEMLEALVQNREDSGLRSKAKDLLNMIVGGTQPCPALSPSTSR